MLLGLRRRRRESEEEGSAADLTPMIDIVFNLLVFFMCASKLRSVEAAIQTWLPKERGTGQGRCVRVNEARIVLRPEPDGAVRVRLGEPLGRVSSGGAPEHDALWPALHARLVALRDTQPGEPLPVIVDAHPEVPTRVVVLAVNEVLRADLREVTFAAPERPDE